MGEHSGTGSVEEPPEDRRKRRRLGEEVEEPQPQRCPRRSSPPSIFGFIPVEAGPRFRSSSTPIPPFSPLPPEDGPIILRPAMIEDFAQELLPGLRGPAGPGSGRSAGTLVPAPGAYGFLGPGWCDETLEDTCGRWRNWRNARPCWQFRRSGFLELDTMEESDLACAQMSSCSVLVRRILDEVGAADPEALFLEGAGGFFQLHPSVEG